MRSRKGLILINAYGSTTRQAQRLKTELTALGASVEIRRNDFFPFVVGETVKGGADCDFVVYLDKDKYNAALFDASVRVFDTARAIELCDDKMQTHIALAGHGIPMPDTLPGLLCYDPSAAVSDAAIEHIERTLGLPVVVKLAYGSQGSGVFLANTRAELKALAEKVKLQPHLFQRYIAKSRGRDMRVIVIGGEVIGGMIRTGRNDFRSNIGLGGTAEKTDVPSDIAKLAVKAAEILGLDYCGIDFLLGDTPLLCEVNSNAFFDAFERATGINVARKYAEHIMKNI